MSVALITERLILRPFRLTDIPHVHRLLDSDPEVKHYTGGICSIERTSEYFQGVVKASEDDPDALVRWAVVHREKNALIGWCGLQPLYFDLNRVELELGYGLARSCWGQGFATEAATAMLHDAFSRLDLPAVVAVVNPSNKASRRVLEKSGMLYCGLVNDDRGNELLYYELKNPNGGASQLLEP